MDNNFLIIGNDEKMKSCKKRLNELKINADCLENNTPLTVIGKYANIILPLPTIINGKIAGTEISLNELNSFLNEKQIVFCGNTKPDNFSCRAFSYYFNEKFLSQNSRLTAQGTLRIILENIKTDLSELSAAVIGYGRCGREICKLLKNTGIDVTSISRRTETLTSAEKNGFTTHRCAEINAVLKNYDIIVNTVPCNIIDDSALEQLRSNTLYIEVASKPYGIDNTKINNFNFKYVPAPGLPGRFTPVSAGRNIADTVAGIIKEGINR